MATEAERKREQRKLDRILSELYRGSANHGESFSEFKRRKVRKKTEIVFGTVMFFLVWFPVIL